MIATLNYQKALFVNKQGIYFLVWIAMYFIVQWNKKHNKLGYLRLLWF